MSFSFDSLRRGYKKTACANGVTLFHSALLFEAGAVHGFTGRSAGVSPPPYDSLNLSFTRPDPRANVLANYKRFSEAAGIPLENMALDTFAHGNAVHIVTEADAGAGIQAPALPEADGLVSSGGMALVTLHADCLCVLFFDPKSEAYGACHAGWRGVAGRVAVNTLRTMETLGARADSTLAWVGPGICANCYEVDEPVISAFEQALPGSGALEYEHDGKARLDLARAMAFQLLEAGISPDHLELSGLCTSCNQDFFSYRRDNGKTGAMAGYIRVMDNRR